MAEAVWNVTCGAKTLLSLFLFSEQAVLIFPFLARVKPENIFWTTRKGNKFLQFTKNMSLVFIYNIFSCISCKHLERTVEVTVVSDFELL